jgi:hypothetical protein
MTTIATGQGWESWFSAAVRLMAGMGSSGLGRRDRSGAASQGIGKEVQQKERFGFKTQQVDP